MQVQFCSSFKPIPRPTLYKQPESTRFGNSSEAVANNGSYHAGKIIGSSAFGATLFAGVGALLNQCFPSINAKLSSLAIMGAVMGPLLSYSQENKAKEKQ